MNVGKMASIVLVSEEMLAIEDGVHQRGHYEVIPLTDADIAAHARAKAAIEEITTNPWVSIDVLELDLRDLEPRERFIPSETTEEWLARWRDVRRAGHAGGGR